MVNLEGAGIKRPPPMAQDAFERVRLVGLIGGNNGIVQQNENRKFTKKLNNLRNK